MITIKGEAADRLRQLMRECRGKRHYATMEKLCGVTPLEGNQYWSIGCCAAQTKWSLFEHTSGDIHLLTLEEHHGMKVLVGAEYPARLFLVLLGLADGQAKGDVE